MRSRQQSPQIESSDPGEEEDKGGGGGRERCGMREVGERDTGKERE